uniref:Uncharacterized protein n=1 Tax=Phlebotomus papatasi TaxID=29031 RepID=A0A1B0DJQ9_PHLPP
MELKCKNCRQIVIKIHEDQIKDAHLRKRTIEEIKSTNCSTVAEDNLFLDEEDLPEWITEEFQASQWTKGKLKCRNCSSTVGSYNFLGGGKCACGMSLIPQIHLIKITKFDYVH